MTLSDKLNERYGKPHLSYSSLKKSLSDMALFDMHMKGVQERSDALDFGTMYDMLLFDPSKAASTYVVLDNGYVLERCSLKTQEKKAPHMTDEFKEIKESIKAELAAKGQVACTQEDWDTANNMIDRLQYCGIVRDYLTGEFQKEVYQEINGVLVKGYIDCFGGHFICDSKSTRSINGFRYDVNSFCYDIQAYIYCTAMGINEFYWVVQEKSYPYLPAVVKCSEETLFRGEMKFQEAVSKIRGFMDSNDKPKIDFLTFTV
jgi:hypothetical protein